MRGAREWRLNGYALGSMGGLLALAMVWIVVEGPARWLVAAVLTLLAAVLMRRQPVAIRVSPEMIVLDHLFGRPRSYLVATIRLALPTSRRPPHVVAIVERESGLRVGYWSIVRRPLWIEREARECRIATITASRDGGPRRELCVVRFTVDCLLFLGIVIVAGAVFDWVLAYTFGAGAFTGLALWLPIGVTVSADRVVVHWLLRPQVVLASQYVRIEVPEHRGRTHLVRLVRIVNSARTEVVAHVATLAEKPAISETAGRLGIVSHEVPRSERRSRAR